MWMKGTPLHFIVNSRSHKNLISAEVVKQLGLPTTPHPQPYHTTSNGFARDELFVSANSAAYHTTSSPSRMRYNVTFPHCKSVMFCYTNHICGSVMLFMSLDPIVSLLLWGSSLQDTIGSSTIVPTKKCRIVISHTAKFILFTICSEEKVTAITTTSTQDASIQQKQINKIVEEHQDILTAPTRVPPYCPVKQSYNKSLLDLHAASSPTESSHTQADHAAISVEWIQPLQQQVHNNIQQAKQDNFFSKASNSPRFRFNKSFPVDLTQWRLLLLKGGRMIQAEISGHPPIPLAQNKDFHLGSFSTSFQVLNFQGRFEALNNVFWAMLCIGLSTLHVCYLRASRHDLLSYP
jgi:hypothetical protein